MIKTLRRKLIIYATTSIFVFLLLILGSINIYNFSSIASEADEITQRIKEEGGQFKEHDDQGGPQPQLAPGQDEPPSSEGGRGQMGPSSPETAMSVRYFTISFDANGANATVIRMQMTQESATQEEAIAWAKSLLSGTKGWTKNYYRYLTYGHQTNTYVTVIDMTRELTPAYSSLNASIIGGLGGVVISFLLLIPISKWLVKPLETANRRQQRFIADASHELKTPITIISAENEITELTGGETESTKNIKKQVTRLTSMVKSLNSLAKLEGGAKPNLGEFDLAQTCREICGNFQRTFDSANIAFTQDIPETLKYNGDTALVSQLINIILDNAKKYGKTRANFRLEKKTDRIVIRVENDADVPDGVLDSAFERFYRSDNARASEKEGSGIGLSIAKEIVTTLKGRISAKGENGFFILKIEL